MKEIHHLIEQMDDGERRDLPGREPVPQHREVRERQARGLHEEADQEVVVSLNFLATRFQCTWPWSTLVMLCDGRLVCGCADPYGHARARRRARRVRSRRLDRRRPSSALRADLNAGGSTFCGDCPLKLPLAEGRGARRPARSTPARCRRGCTSSARRPATSPAPRPAARRKPASRGRGRPACSTSISSRA